MNFALLEAHRMKCSKFERAEKKTDWNPPRTVRYQNNYYRLEACASGMPPRPFRYTLRKLSAGVMGRTVLIYSPGEEPVLAKK